MTLKKIKILLTIFFIIVYCFIIYEYQYLKFPNTYTITEWLINYQGGFVRRGLLGEFLYFFYEKKIFNLANIFYLSVSLLYSSIIILYSKAINKIEIDKILLIQLFSPLFLIYPLIEVDIIGRKEIFLFLLILLYINFFIAKSIKFQLLYIFTVTNFLFFIHEGLIFYFQFFLLIFYISNTRKINNKNLISIFIFGLFYFASLIFISLFLVNETLKIDVMMNSYSDLTFKNLGAFFWIEKDLNFAINKLNEFVNFIIVLKFFLLYVLFNVLFFCYYFSNRVIFISLIICNFVSIPIFFIALDWGRFIFTLFNLNLIVILLLKKLNLIENRFLFKNNYLVYLTILIITFSNPKVTLFEEINYLPYKDFLENLIKLI